MKASRKEGEKERTMRKQGGRVG
jgi:hypothetical protein